MVVYKCKMCGGDLSVNDKFTIGKCKYCGSTMTLPKSTDQIRINLFNRANHFRMNYEFDKASGIYESILNQDDTDAEAYWGLVLCEYGIIYVEDQETHKMISTCHRTQYVSILADPYFKAAFENSDIEAQKILEIEADAIDKIQKQILEISSKEEPFDVFICYKETDMEGNRSKDSVLAQDLYYLLNQQGFKVFFSRITLEEKIGSAYEPYIFAALNTSKVMVVVGTRPEHINSPWVRNEWSRFLALIRKGEPITLIPAYQDMDPYELPDEFSYLQAQDMSKLGFMQDLIRGIKKIIFDSQTKESKKESGGFLSTNATTTGLIERAFLCLEDEDFRKADNLLEQALNSDPRNSKAYVGKLMLDLNMRNESELVKASQPLTDYKNYQRAIQFADSANRTKLEGYNQTIVERIELERKENLYENALIAKQLSSYASEFHLASKKFGRIPGYKDADSLALECKSLALEAEKKFEIRRRKTKIFSLTFLGVIIVVIVTIIILEGLIIPKFRLRKALNFISEGQYSEAFEILNEFEELPLQIEEILYDEALKLKSEEQYGEALNIIYKLGDFKVSSTLENQLYKLGREIYLLISEDLLSVGNREEVSNYFIPENDLNKISSIAKRLMFYNQGIISAGDECIFGVKSNGTIESMGKGSYGQCDVSNWRYIVAVSAGPFHTVGLKSDGTVVATGKIDSDQCNVSNWSDIVAVSAGSYHTVGLKSDGTVVGTGKNHYSQCDVSNWSDIVAVYAGSYHTVGLKSDGTVVAMGKNDFGQCNVSNWRDIVAVSAGSYHTVGLKLDGTVVGTYKGNGQLEVYDWLNIVFISANSSVTAGLKVDGSVILAGLDDPKPEWNDIISIAVGHNYVIGLRMDGSVVAYGLPESMGDSYSSWSLFDD